MEQTAPKPETQQFSQLQAPPSVSLRVGVVVLAAGKGERFGGNVPKQFALLGGKPVVAHSVKALARLGSDNVIAVVLSDPWHMDKLIKKALIEAWKGSNSALALPLGGARRQDSVAAGLAALSKELDIALVHDAARPFPPLDAIATLVERTMICGGGLLAARATDTIKRAADEPGGPVVAETIDRESIWLAQTPQAIRADLIPRAIEELRRRDLNVTDEASLLESWGIPVALIESPASNFKITTADDLARAEAMLARRLP